MTVPCGWTGKFLEIDLSTGSVAERDTMPYARSYVGGRGIAARLAWETIPAGTDAYSPDNRLILFTGPLTGTIAPTSGRSVFMSVSPRVYPRPWITIGGKAESAVYVSIEDGNVQIHDADELWGLGIRDTDLWLKRKHGSEAHTISIGPAGENLVRVATIQHADECASGHSGFGAVLGSKMLKAVVVRGTGGVKIARPEVFFAEVERTRETAWISPMHCFDFPLEGPPASAGRKAKGPVCSQSCPVYCVITGLHRVEGLPDTVTTCIGGVYMGGAVYGIGEDLIFDISEYQSETISTPAGKSFGEVDGVRVHQTANSLGLDLWLLATLQPWFLRCLEEGVGKIRGTVLDPTDPDWFIEMLEGLAMRRGLGGLFSDGLRRAADELESELPRSLIDTARSLEFAFGFPAHREGRLWDPEPLPYWVISMLMYASESRDPTIGTHSSCFLLADLYMKYGELALKKFRRLSEELWGSDQGLEPNYEFVVPVTLWAQHQHIAIDSLPLCDFVFPRTIGKFKSEEEWLASDGTDPDIELGARLLSACTGVDYTDEQLEHIGERVFNVERSMLAEFGRDRTVDASIEPHFELPCKTDGTCLDEPLFEELLDDYYKFRGWDLKRGWPSREKLEELGLKDVADRLGL